MDAFPVDGFRFRKLFRKHDIADARIKDGYVEYRYLADNGRYRWARRYELVWGCYKKYKRRFGWHIHHKNFNKVDDRPSNLAQITREDHVKIHGVVYSVYGIGGSSRNTGVPHTQRTKDKMSQSMAGNSNMPVMRDEKWCERIKRAQGRIVRRGINPSMRKIVEMYVRGGMSTADVAEKFGVGGEVVKRRLQWFIEDNFDERIGLPQMRWSLEDVDLSELDYFDEQERLEQTAEYKIVKQRVCCGKMQGDIIKMYGLDMTCDEVGDIVKKFYAANGLEKDIFLKDAKKVIRERGLLDMVQKMKDKCI